MNDEQNECNPHHGLNKHMEAVHKFRREVREAIRKAAQGPGYIVLPEEMIGILMKEATELDYDDFMFDRAPPPEDLPPDKKSA
ncbi:hypothetical protein K8R43_06320 [archaeon]|nr:hypothetical protein [archaeon]